jgi:hypothetical protein
MARMAPILAAALIAATPAGAATHPTLKAVRMQPLTVRGAGFVPRERVVVRMAQARVVVRTSRLGGFVVAFATYDRCTGGRVIAIGTSGDHALHRLPPVMCPPG